MYFNLDGELLLVHIGYCLSKKTSKYAKPQLCFLDDFSKTGNCISCLSKYCISVGRIFDSYAVINVFALKVKLQGFVQVHERLKNRTPVFRNNIYMCIALNLSPRQFMCRMNRKWPYKNPVSSFQVFFTKNVGDMVRTKPT